MDHWTGMNELLRRIPAGSSNLTLTTAIAYAIALVFCFHQALVYLDFAILSPVEILWNALVYITPARIILDTDKRTELGKSPIWSQVHAAKSEALRRMLGLGSERLMQQLPATTTSLMRKMSISVGTVKSDVPPGLGNWDNSCYQNSVLQGLTSLNSINPFLSTYLDDPKLPSNSTSSALNETVGKLKGAENNGKHIWTPAKLKSMSSWQQQDAQEYYSKIVDELEKEAGKVFGTAKPSSGLEAVAEEDSRKNLASAHDTTNKASQSPLEGLLAQRVACTRCGFSEGLSMIPFNCLTVPLGSRQEYGLNECLDEYTGLEEISDVECTKCTLLKAQSELKRMLPQSEEPKGSENDDVPRSGQTADAISKVLNLPPDLRAKFVERLHAIESALEADDFSDKTLKEACQISKKARVSSTKTRQAVVGRAPRSLVIHVNRSVFDEMTGDQRKNYAAVRYPLTLDLGQWVLGDRQQGLESAEKEAVKSMLSREGFASCKYTLKAVITHYGRHENGHYIAYRQHPTLEKTEDEKELDRDDLNEEREPQWWRLSDEDVSRVSKEDVLGQGGVFMLFYERDELSDSPSTGESTTIADQHNEQQLEASAESEPSSIEYLQSDDGTEPVTAALEVSDDASIDPTVAATNLTTEDESETEVVNEQQPAQLVQQKPPTPPLMKTAGGMGIPSSRSEGGFGFASTLVAAT